MERHIPGGGGQVSVIVTAAVALTGLAALVAGCLGEFFCFGFQKLVECLLHAAADQFLDLPLDYSSLNCTMLLDMVCRLLSECVSQLHSTRERRAVSTFLPSSICAIYYTLSKLLPQRPNQDQRSIPHMFGGSREVSRASS